MDIPISIQIHPILDFDHERASFPSFLAGIEMKMGLPAGVIHFEYFYSGSNVSTFFGQTCMPSMLLFFEQCFCLKDSRSVGHCRWVVVVRRERGRCHQLIIMAPITWIVSA